METWVCLDTRFYSNHKIELVGNAGAGLYARCLAYCGDHLTDGFIPAAFARRVGSKSLIDKLTTAGLWEKVENGFNIPDYLVLNRSREEVLQIVEKRREAGRKGAQARWQKPSHDAPPPDMHRICDSDAIGCPYTDTPTHNLKSVSGVSVVKGSSSPPPIDGITTLSPFAYMPKAG